jgi:hypothetical protein
MPEAEDSCRVGHRAAGEALLERRPLGLRQYRGEPGALYLGDIGGARDACPARRHLVVGALDQAATPAAAPVAVLARVVAHGAVEEQPGEPGGHVGRTCLLALDPAQHRVVERVLRVRAVDPSRDDRLPHDARGVSPVGPLQLRRQPLVHRA